MYSLTTMDFINNYISTYINDEINRNVEKLISLPTIDETLLFNFDEFIKLNNNIYYQLHSFHELLKKEFINIKYRINIKNIPPPTPGNSTRFYTNYAFIIDFNSSTYNIGDYCISISFPNNILLNKSFSYYRSGCYNNNNASYGNNDEHSVKQQCINYIKSLINPEIHIILPVVYIDYLYELFSQQKYDEITNYFKKIDNFQLETIINENKGYQLKIAELSQIISNHKNNISIQSIETKKLHDDLMNQTDEDTEDNEDNEDEKLSFYKNKVHELNEKLNYIENVLIEKNLKNKHLLHLLNFKNDLLDKLQLQLINR
jgi:hypothetical protein